MGFLGILIWTFFAVLSGKVAEAKGYSPITGLVLGFLLGIFGLIIASILPNKKEIRK